eukprot:GEMP01001121.1.p1 GENE.GEMP01001121.1~~GEMP01001121.1.p1  ORF type:complete len:1190 (+),score=271.25 GEMP01001121.1:68-3571(+)
MRLTLLFLSIAAILILDADQPESAADSPEPVKVKSADVANAVREPESGAAPAPAAPFPTTGEQNDNIKPPPANPSTTPSPSVARAPEPAGQQAPASPSTGAVNQDAAASGGVATTLSKVLSALLPTVSKPDPPPTFNVSCRYVDLDATHLSDCPTWMSYYSRRSPANLRPSGLQMTIYRPTRDSLHYEKPRAAKATAVDTPEKKDPPKRKVRIRPRNMCATTELLFDRSCKGSDAPKESRIRRPDTMCSLWETFWMCDVYDAAVTSQIWTQLGPLVAEKLFGSWDPAAERTRKCKEDPVTNATLCESHPISWTSDSEAKLFTYAGQKPRKPVVEEPKHRYLLGEPYNPSLFKEKIDFASAAGGARLSNHSANMNYAKALLATDNEYMLVPCDGKPWYVVSLGHDVNLEQIGLVSKEFFASAFRYLQILGSNTYPTEKWRLLGEIESHASITHEIFDLKNTCSRQKLGCWVKFVKVRVLGYHPMDDYYYCAITRFQVFGSTVMEGISELYPDEDDTMDQNLKSPTINDMITGMENMLQGALNNPLVEAENFMDPLKAVVLDDVVDGTKNLTWPNSNETMNLDTIVASTKETDAAGGAAKDDKDKVPGDNNGNIRREGASGKNDKADAKQGDAKKAEGSSPNDDDFGKLPLDKWRPEDLWDPQANAKWAWLLPVADNTSDPGVLLRLLIQEFQWKGLRDGPDWLTLSWDDQSSVKPPSSSGVPPLVRLGDHLRSLETQHLQLVNATLKMRWLIGRQEGAMQLLSNVALPMYDALTEMMRKLHLKDQQAERCAVARQQKIAGASGKVHGFCPICTPQQHWSNECLNMTRAAALQDIDTDIFEEGLYCPPEYWKSSNMPIIISPAPIIPDKTLPITPPPPSTQNDTDTDTSTHHEPDHTTDVWVLPDISWERWAFIVLLSFQLLQWIQLYKTRTVLSNLTISGAQRHTSREHTSRAPSTISEATSGADSDLCYSLIIPPKRITRTRMKRSNSYENQVNHKTSTRAREPSALGGGVSVPPSPINRGVVPVGFDPLPSPTGASVSSTQNTHTVTGATGRLLRREFDSYMHTRKSTQYNRHVKREGGAGGIGLSEAMFEEEEEENCATSVSSPPHSPSARVINGSSFVVTPQEGAHAPSTSSTTSPSSANSPKMNCGTDGMTRRSRGAMPRHGY